MSATVVTALFDLGRGDLEDVRNNKRPFSKYLQWFSLLLEVDCFLEIWTSSDVADFIWRRRTSANTFVHVIDLQEMPMYPRRSDMSRAMNKTSKGNAFLKEHVEFISPDYNVVTFSKAALLRRAAVANRFGSTHFVWFDAGGLRQRRHKPRGRWPNVYKLESLGELFLFAKQSLAGRAYAEAALSDIRAFVRRHDNAFWGFVFGGTRDGVLRWAARMDQAVDAMLRDNAMNNDQHAMVLAAALARDEVRVLPLSDRAWDPLPRVLLGGETPVMPWPYRSEQGRVLVASFNDAGVKERDLLQLSQSAAFFGYPLVLLGRDQPAVRRDQRWRLRTRAYLSFALSVPAETVLLLCDGTDVFFCASAAEFHDVFSAMNSRCVIGGESIVAYAESGTSKRTKEESERFFGGCGRHACFPNAGLVVGRPEALCKLLEANLDSQDDQTGIYDLIMDGWKDVSVDRESVLLGNAPYHHFWKEQPEDVWSFDGRFKHNVTGGRPCVMHFPGHRLGVRRQNSFFDRLLSWPPPPLRPSPFAEAFTGRLRVMLTLLGVLFAALLIPLFCNLVARLKGGPESRLL